MVRAVNLSFEMNVHRVSKRLQQLPALDNTLCPVEFLRGLVDSRSRIAVNVIFMVASFPIAGYSVNLP